MEDPEYGSHSLDKLKEIADAMDCALLVKFIPFSMLVLESQHLSPRDLVAKSYDEELGAQ